MSFPKNHPGIQANVFFWKLQKKLKRMLLPQNEKERHISTLLSLGLQLGLPPLVPHIFFSMLNLFRHVFFFKSKRKFIVKTVLATFL